MPSSARQLACSPRLGAVLATLLATGCAAGGAQGAAPGAAAAEAGGRAGAGQFTPGVAGAPAYGESVGRCGAPGVIRAVTTELDTAAKRGGHEPVSVEPTLCAAAEAFMRWDPAVAPRPQVLAFVSQWFGLPTTIVPPAIATFQTTGTDSGQDTDVIAERIVQAVGNTVLNMVHPRIGIATLPRRGTTKVVVVMVDSPVEIAPPFPKKLAPGQKATLTGRLLSGLTAPKVQVSDVSGQVSTPPQAAGDAFSAELACGDRPGRLLVEIRAEYQGQSGVVANFPVACGQDLPTSVSIAPEPWPGDPAEAEKRIAELVNTERTSAGLPPLKWDPAVAAVARGISQDLAKNPGAPIDVGERLKKEGIASQIILQSAASERSFERVHERLVTNPSNRANIMSREVNTVGIGGVSGTGPDGKPLVTVTELFTKALPPVDLGKVRQDLKAAVARKRQDARMSPLAVAPMLDEAAQKYAEALAAAGGTLTKEQEAPLTAPLTKTMRTLTILSGAKPDPLDFAEEPQVTAVAKSVGVGVAQGRHPVLGRNAVYVVIMVGTTRAEAAEPVTGSGKATAKPKKKPAR